MRGLSSVFRWTPPASSSALRGVPAAVPRCNRLIEAYCKEGLLQEGRRLFDEMPERNVFTWNAMIGGYVKNKDLAGARALFDAAPMRDSVTYNSLISGYARQGCGTLAVDIFADMRRRGPRADEFTLPTMLNVAAELTDVHYGRQIHACAVKTGNDSDGFGVSSLIDMYSKTGCFFSALEAYRASGNKVDLASKNAMVAACCREGKMEMAFELFYFYGLSTPLSRDSVSWNTMISGCVQNGHANVALELFVNMTEDGATWNEHTIASILGACSLLKSLNHGKQVHAFILKNEMKSNPFIMGSIIDFYCKLNELAYAQAIYAETCRSNAFATTSMVMGHAGRGEMGEARQLFDALDVKVSPALTALLSGYLKSQNYEAIFHLLLEFRREKWQMLIFDELVLVNILIACSQQADLDHGKQVHAYVVRTGFEIEEKLGSTLVDMYAKCGEIESASTIFQHLSFKDHVSYNVMLAGFAHHGREKEALQLFEEMKAGGLWPDAVTFIAVLSACRHAGLINAGETHFNSMTQDYGISPEIDHYACMIDLYGRAKRLDKAIFMMNCIPFELDTTVLGAFLNACRISGNTYMAKDVEEMMLRAEAHNGARYVQLANVFASEGEWKEVERIRRKMRGREAKRPAGCSWLHVDNRVNSFTSGDSFHSQAPEIYAVLAVLSADMMETEPAVVRGVSLNYALQLLRPQFYF